MPTEPQAHFSVLSKNSRLFAKKPSLISLQSCPMAIPSNPDKNRDILCHCSGTTRRQITDLIDGGIDHPENISRMTGAGAGCGACETAILDLLSEYSRVAAKTGG